MSAPVRVGVLWLLFLVCLRPARADSPAPSAAPPEAQTELTVSSAPGFLLMMDDQPIGRLPLDGPLLVSGGPHRFQLDRQGHRYVSDVLTIPQGRIAELSLSPGSSGTAIAVLSLTPMILLVIEGRSPGEAREQALRAAVQEGARAEHLVLVPAARAAALKGDRADCAAGRDCQLRSAAEVEARLVLRLELPPLPAPAPEGSGGPLPSLRGEVLDVSTGQSAARAEQPYGSDEAQLLEAAQQLTRQLLTGAAKLGRGMLSVTSQPPGARVCLDGRPRGETPFVGPSLAGRRELLITKPGFVPHRAELDLAAGQVLEVPVQLAPLQPEPESAPPVATAPPGLPPPPPLPRPRPRWRLATGGLAIGLGAVLSGLGAYGISQDGACADPTPRLVGNCSYLYATAGLGGGGLAVGLSLVAAGVGLVAAPGPRAPRPDGVRK